VHKVRHSVCMYVCMYVCIEDCEEAGREGGGVHVLCGQLQSFVRTVIYKFCDVCLLRC